MDGWTSGTCKFPHSISRGRDWAHHPSCVPGKAPVGCNEGEGRAMSRKNTETVWGPSRCRKLGRGCIIRTNVSLFLERPPPWLSGLSALANGLHLEQTASQGVAPVRKRARGPQSEMLLPGGSVTLTVAQTTLQVRDTCAQCGGR